MKQPSLIWHVFVAILVVALLGIAVNGLITRSSLDASFERYLTTMNGSGTTGSATGQDGTQGNGTGNGMGMGSGSSGSGQGMMWRHMLLGSAEQAFLADVENGIALSALLAVILAAIAALVLARALASPLRGLTNAARVRSAGTGAPPVPARGPAEVAELAVAFNDMTRSLDEAETLRQRMVADIAHELRNPIAALRAQIEGIADGVLIPDSARIASLVDDVGALSRLVDDMQELSRADAGELRYSREPFDLAELVVREAERLRVLVRPGVHVVSIPPETPLIVTGDEFRIAQVVRNLLSNAARHTAAGSITVSATGEGRFSRVTVADTGEGMRPEDLAHIWERFYRADAARAADGGGAGVGLSIARRIVEDHGGSVFAESAPGVGSRVGFRLPPQ